MTFEEVLSRDGRLVYKTRGSSMEPMLRQDRDLVVIEPKKSRLEKFDVALYRRGGDYVLHRVIGVRGGYYVIRGDNTYAKEKVGEENVIGVLTSFVRKGKRHGVTERGYRFYVRFNYITYPLRRARVGSIRLLKAAAKKLGLAPLLKKLFKRK